VMRKITDCNAFTIEQLMDCPVKILHTTASHAYISMRRFW